MRALWKIPKKFAKIPKSAGPIPFHLRSVLKTSSSTDLITKLQSIGGLTHLFPEKSQSSTALNGKNTFIPQCHKITLLYNPSSKTSIPLLAFIQIFLAEYARQYPYIEFVIKPDHFSKPTIIAAYANGRIINTEIKKGNDIGNIVYALQELVLRKGEDLEIYRAPVVSDEQVVQIWDPFRSNLTFKP